MCMHAKLLQSCPTLCDPVDYSLPRSSVHGFSRLEYWSGFPYLPPGDLPDPRMEPISPAAPALQADSLPLSHHGSPASANGNCTCLNELQELVHHQLPELTQTDATARQAY